jgi:hypothetical protein
VSNRNIIKLFFYKGEVNPFVYSIQESKLSVDKHLLSHVGVEEREREGNVVNKKK